MWGSKKKKKKKEKKENLNAEDESKDSTIIKLNRVRFVPSLLCGPLALPVTYMKMDDAALLHPTVQKRRHLKPGDCTLVMGH